MNEKEKLQKIAKDWELLSLGRMPARETAYLYMERYRDLLVQHRQLREELSAEVLHRDIRYDDLLDKFQMVLDEAQRKGVMLHGVEDGEKGLPDHPGDVQGEPPPEGDVEGEGGGSQEGSHQEDAQAGDAPPGEGHHSDEGG